MTQTHITISEQERPRPIEGVFFQMMTFPDGRKRFLRVSSGSELLLGFSEAQLMQNHLLFYSHILEADRALFEAAETLAAEQLEMMNFNFRYALPEQDFNWLNLKMIPQKTAAGDYVWSGLLSDINEFKAQEFKLQKANHELQILNAVNDVILKCQFQECLLEDLCWVLVEKGNYKLAWIAGMSSLNIQESKIEPIAAAGELNYLKEISIMLTDSTQIKGPTITALLRQKIVVTDNVERSATFIPWRDAAVKYGIHSSIAIPFMVNGEKYVLNVYSSKTDAFDQHEKDILERVSLNITQAMDKMREEQQRKEYYTLLQERVKELSVIAEVSDILRTESHIERALIRIAQAVPEGLSSPDQSSVVFLFAGKNYGQTLSAHDKIIYERQIDLLYKNHLKIIVYKTSDEVIESTLSAEKILLLNNISKKVQLYIDNKTTLRQLERSQSNLYSVFENTDVGYMLLTLNGEIVSFNRQVYRELLKLYGVKIAVGMSLTEDVLQDNAARFISHFITAKINHKASEYEAHYEYKGKSKYFVVSVFPVLSKTKECLSVCLTMKDITKTKLSEIEGKRITNDLIVRNRDLEQFSFMISHNLRAPVVNLTGLTQQLKEGLPHEEAQFVMDSIINSASRIEGVIDDINKILMIKNGAETNRSRISMVHLLDELQSYFIEVHTGKSPEFHIDVKDVEHLDSNKAYIESVFYNLISNAVKFAKPESPAKIKIWTVRRKDKIMIHFKDDGIGIDLEKHQHNVFKLYNRFHNHIEGRGMGLYMTKTQIRLLGGDIEVHSSPNQGTEFIITLPVEA